MVKVFDLIKEEGPAKIIQVLDRQLITKTIEADAPYTCVPLEKLLLAM